MITPTYPALNFQKPTLSIEMVDGKTKRLVWQGSRELSLPSNPSPVELDKTFQEAVTALLAYYPPPPPKK